MEQEFLSAEQVGALLGCHARRVCTLARAGRIKGEMLPKSRPGYWVQWRFQREAVNAFINSPDYGLRLVRTVPITASRDELIWFAGFFDGEGCVNIQRRKDGGCWHLSILIPNTARSVIESLPALFGGSTHATIQHDHQRMAQVRWRASGRQAGIILRALLPHLRVKRRQAELAVEFQERVDAASNNGHRPVSAEDRAWRDAAYERMRWLNHHYE